ncbi:MAG TPA: GNAT family N-acetyltransferase [Tepidisphaeraceae bacterium]|jgi:RimJ/RimL family protein N-acetyltransferase|nr:GNAT family N-acetyltransferase [Tepidisphaeraceae bacterium]
MLIAETPRLILRHFHPTDASALTALFADPAVMRFGDGPQSPDWTQSWLSTCITQHYPQWGFGPYAVTLKQTSTLIGYCGLTRFPGRCPANEAELGFRLAQPYWRRGFATESAQAVCTHAFYTLHLPRLIAHIDPANTPSIRVIKKLGFHYEREAMLSGYDHPDHLFSLYLQNQVDTKHIQNLLDK